MLVHQRVTMIYLPNHKIHKTDLGVDMGELGSAVQHSLGFLNVVHPTGPMPWTIPNIEALPH